LFIPKVFLLYVFGYNIFVILMSSFIGGKQESYSQNRKAKDKGEIHE